MSIQTRSRLNELVSGQPSMESHGDNESYALEGGVESFETAMLDINEAEREVEDCEQDVASLESIEEGLTQINASMESAMEFEGGLNQASADLAHLAVSAYTSQFGLESTEILPSLENFGGDSGRQSATQISMESISGKIKQMWDAIVRAVKKAMAAVANFFKKIFSATVKIEKRWSALKKTVDGLSDKEVTAKDGKMKVPSADRLKVKGDVRPAAIIAGLGNLETMNQEIFDKYLEKVSTYYTQALDSIKVLAGSDNESDADTQAGKVDGALGDVVKAVTVSESNVAPGDKVLTTTTESDSEDGDSKMIRVTNAKNTKKVDDAQIEVPSQSDLQKVLDAGEKVLARIKDKKDEVEKVQKAREDAIKDADKAISSSDAGRMNKMMSKRSAKRVLKSVQKDVLKPATQLASLNMSVLQSVSKYVETSAKQYGDKASDDS